MNHGIVPYVGGKHRLAHRIVEINLHYQDLIRVHGDKPDAILFVDPPYEGTESYYARSFGRADHVFLAQQLGSAAAHVVCVVCTYYETPLTRGLYPADRWEWLPVDATKNANRPLGHRAKKTTEWVISDGPRSQTSCQSRRKRRAYLGVGGF